jgi:Rhodopirellula transposase DDE domain
MGAQKWLRSSLRSLRDRLAHAGHQASAPTVRGRVQKHGYALRVNTKQTEAGAQHPERDAPFRSMERQKQTFLAAGEPSSSVDTKNKDLIGDFKNAGPAWRREAEVVNGPDVLSEALGRGVPYGIYDVQRHDGAVYVGQSADTAEFAVHAIGRWGHEHGHQAYPKATQRLILADAGGSNGCRPRVWKAQGQSQWSDTLGLAMTVGHYPTGGSKWHPIAHRLLSHISLHWAGHPWRSFEAMLGLIRGTSTRTGLTVAAHLLDGVFEKGKKVTDAVMKTLHMTRHAICPHWNYTFRPRLGQALAPGAG